jgi:S1-C subfamily serine protease
MPFDDDDPDNGAFGTGPLPPEDRLWRHPSEVGGAPAPKTRSSRAVTAVAALGGAAATIAVIAIIGALSERTSEQPRAVERVATPAFGTVPVIASATPQPADADGSLVTVESGGASAGTGVLLRSDGHVVTAATLVGENEQVQIETADGERGVASVVGRDATLGLAVLAVTWLDERLSAVTATADGLAIGDMVRTISADGEETTGLVSDLSATADAPGRTFHGLVRTTGALPPDGVGGPVVTTDGHVVAVALWSDSSPATWSVPIDIVRRVVSDIVLAGRVLHPWLGVEGLDEPGGPELSDVAIGGPAAEAGLRPGDIIERVDHRPVATMADIVLALREHHPGDTVSIDYRRDDRSLTCSPQLDERVS